MPASNLQKCALLHLKFEAIDTPEGVPFQTLVYLEQQKLLAARVREFLRDKYQLELTNVVIEQPPKVFPGAPNRDAKLRRAF